MRAMDGDGVDREDEEAVNLLLGTDPDAGPARGAPGSCPDEEALATLAEGRGQGSGREGVEDHLAGCPACRALVAALLRESPAPAFLEHEAPAGGAPPPPPVLPKDLAGDGAPPPPARAAETRASGAEEEGGAPAAAAGIPASFGPYRIVRRIGAGGMGVVYEAVHPQRQRSEALKVLKGGLGDLPEFTERFHREVRALANLSHDHVVRLFDSGRVGDQLYYTMPLLHGTSLAELTEEIKGTGEAVPATLANGVLDRRGVPAAPGEPAPPTLAYARRVAAALAGVADALALMHGQGIVHRDIKPSNLMLDERGRVLLADFGLVRTGDERITRTGQAMGTPAYMSPEQVLPTEGDPDGRSDVYALGATLFELLTLVLPHEGTSVQETMVLKLKRRVRSVRDLSPDLPADLETIVGRCLERRPTATSPPPRCGTTSTPSPGAPW